MNLALLRNIGIIAHIDAGKTTFSERVLFYANAIHRMGEVHEGAATMDFMPEEQERGITIAAACTTCQWQGHTINLVDTPGHVDFTVEVERSLRVLDAAVGIFCGVSGVEPQSETVWRQAESFGIPKLAVINKLDRPGASYETVFKALGERLDARAVPVTVPWNRDGEFAGVLDIVRRERLEFDPATRGRQVTRTPFGPEESVCAAPWRERLLDALTEADDVLLERCLAGEDPPAVQVDAALRRAVLERGLVPVYAASALRNTGIQPVMDGVCAYLPSPAELPPVRAYAAPEAGKGGPAGWEDEVFESGKVPEGADRPGVTAIAPDPAAPACALVFKVVLERGRPLCFARLYAGTLAEGDQVVNVGRGTVERVSALYRVLASSRERLERAEAGDIVALQGLKSAQTGDTLADRKRLVLLEPIRHWCPVISLAFEPRNAEEGARLDEALAGLGAEDPTLRVELDDATGQRIVSGMGELHLDVLRERMEREYGVRPRVGNPQVVCRETVRNAAGAAAEFERELGGQAHYGRVRLRLEPARRGAGLAVTWAAGIDEDIPRPLREAARQGVLDAAWSGPQGYPVDDVAVSIEELCPKNGQGTPAGFHMAAQAAMRKALEEARPVLLEPVMQVDVTTPEPVLGAVLSLLNARSARVENVEEKAGLMRVAAQAPMRELFGFATALRSATRGRAGLVLRFARFDVL